MDVIPNHTTQDLDIVYNISKKVSKKYVKSGDGKLYPYSVEQFKKKVLDNAKEGAKDKIIKILSGYEYVFLIKNLGTDKATAEKVSKEIKDGFKTVFGTEAKCYILNGKFGDENKSYGIMIPMNFSVSMSTEKN